MGKANNVFFAINDSEKKEFLFLPTHLICLMKICHFKKGEEVKRKKDAPLNMEMCFQRMLFFDERNWGKRLHKTFSKKIILFLTNLSIEDLCVHF